MFGVAGGDAVGGAGMAGAGEEAIEESAVGRKVKIYPGHSGVFQYRSGFC